MRLDLFITAITPGIALALMIYFTDRYDKEPIRLLLKVFVFGMLISIPVLIVETIFSYFNVFSGILSIIFTSFIVAGLTEEFFKRQVVIKLAFKHEAFDEKLDGIVYAVFASLGFATLENIMYVVFAYTNVNSVWIMRAILAVPAHMLFAITMGYYLSLAKYAPDEKSYKLYYRKSLISPIIMHGIYDFIVLSQFPYLFLIFIPFMIYLWVTNLRKLNRYYHESKEASKIR